MIRREFIKTSGLALIALQMSKFDLFAASAFSIEGILKKAEKEKWSALPLNGIMMKVGSELIGVPYVGGTLEGNEIEKCVVSSEGLDCVTFMETTLDMSRIIRKKKFTLDDLINEVTFTRYRDGNLAGYDSRLHYTKEWILNNVKKGNIKNITADLGGIEFKNQLSFMSKNPKYYAPLKDNPEMVKKIASIEKIVNSVKILYIPNDKIKAIESKLQSGDIIAIATSKDGLDYSHVGLINKEKDKISRFFHASSKEKKVYLDVAISDYMAKVKSNIGITVLRPI